MNFITRGIILFFIAPFFFQSCDKNEVITRPENATTMSLSGTGSFTYSSYQPLASKPVEVYYHIPENATSTSPVLMVFHGGDRNGTNARDRMIAKADLYNCIVVVPEFSNAYYSGGDAYNLGNIFEDGDNPSLSTLNDESVWTFSLIEPLFDHMKQETGNVSTTYDIFGFSAGGQVAHRYLLFKPNARYHRIVAASSGWYTVPDDQITFPYGIEESPADSLDLAVIFSKPLFLVIGDQDNDPNASGLRHNSFADAQGLHRFSRAGHFYAESQSIAIGLGSTYVWQYHELPNVGHDFQATSNYAMDLLY